MGRNPAPLWSAALVLALPVPPCRPQSAPGLDQVRALFASPPREYSPGPLWVWNDEPTAEGVRASLRELAAQGIRQAWVHPRPGLITTYLTPEWFDLWRAALAEAERLGVALWIYDENSYPSGFAGGWVPELMPEARGLNLAFRELAAPPAPGGDYIAVFCMSEEGPRDVTAALASGEALPPGRYLVAEILPDRPTTWHAGRTYVDLLREGVTEKFIAVTLEAYKREIGRHFGALVPGVFTDEPRLMTRGHHWSPGLPAGFAARWGYGLRESLPSLHGPYGDWRRVRHNFQQLLLEGFLDRWARPMFAWCERNGLIFTGHYWEHTWPDPAFVPDSMAAAAWEHWPGIDTLFNQYEEGPHAQFGNVRAVLELASLANQLGRKRTFCEAFGGSGWELRFEEMKRIGDWLLVLGVNALNLHLTHLSLRGARKRDYPPSFAGHQPWWDDFHHLTGYFARLSAVLAQGEQINRILLLEPTTTAWMYSRAADGKETMAEIGRTFQRLVTELARAQVELDLGCEAVLATDGACRQGRLFVGRRGYDTLVLPPGLENLNGPTMALVEAFAAGGGRIMCCGDPPDRVDGAVSPRGRECAGRAGWQRVEAAALPALLAESAGRPAVLSDGKGILYHHRRRLADGELLFLANASRDEWAGGEFEAAAGGVELWEPETGRTDGYPFERLEGKVRGDFSLPPGGSLLLALSRAELPPAPPRPGVGLGRSAARQGEPELRRLGPNVLVLDYVDLEMAAERREGVPVLAAADLVFRKHGLAGNPWHHAVQFKDETRRLTFPPESGFAASYRFQAAGPVPADLALVVERPDLYTVRCNGREVRAEAGRTWLDPAFGVIPLAGAAREGENLIRLEASPFTVRHELEAAFLIGDFALEPAARGFAVVPARALAAGPAWAAQGCPFYGGAVACRQRFDLGEREPEGTWRVVLPEWHGSVARVEVNGYLAGRIAGPPGRLDVGHLLRSGVNEVTVTVVGTLRNTLGPHHGRPVIGLTGPGHFGGAPDPGPPPGSAYFVVDYGLKAPFVLEQESAAGWEGRR